MKYNEAKDNFIQTWGSLGTLWGINKAMAQIHALLLISPEPLSMEEIMASLHISRGNTSTNLRSLMEWGIVFKKNKVGDRKEYFYSEKDVYELARQIGRERSRREIQPTMKVLREVSSMPADGTTETKELIKQTKELYALASKADDIMQKIVNQEANWFTKTIIKLLK